ncbi:MAG: hypothetical protein ACTSQJ_12200 [Promethearchaeota archaeon]
MEIEILEKIKQKGISDDQRTQIYELTRKVSRKSLDEICPALLRLLLNTEKGPLKNQIGQVIFHLQKNERLNTIIGLQKLIDAGLIAAPEEMFEILESSEDDVKELAQKIKSIL